MQYNANTKIMMADCSCMHELKDRLLWPGGMHILTFEIREKLFHNYNMIAFTGEVWRRQ